MRQLLHHDAESRRRDGQIVSGALRVAELVAKGFIGCRIVEVTIHVTEQLAQLWKCLRIQATVLFDAVFGPGLKLLKVPAGLGHADDRDAKRTTLDHGLQRRKDFFVREVTRRAKKNQSVGMWLVHFGVPPFFSRCPPKPNRIAESSLS